MKQAARKTNAADDVRADVKALAEAFREALLMLTHDEMTAINRGFNVNHAMTVSELADHVKVFVRYV